MPRAQENNKVTADTATSARTILLMVYGLKLKMNVSD
jgi:hypothetical protein